MFKFTKKEQELLEPSKDSRVSQDRVLLGGVQRNLLQNGRDVLNPFDPKFDRLVINPSRGPVDVMTEAVRDKLSSAISPELWKLPEDSRLNNYMEQFDQVASNQACKLDLNSLINSATDKELQISKLKGKGRDDLINATDEEKKNVAKYVIATRLLNDEVDVGPKNNRTKKKKIEVAQSLEKKGRFIGILDGKALFADDGPSFAPGTENMTCEKANTFVDEQGLEMFPHNKADKCDWISLKKENSDEFLSDAEILKKLLESKLFSKEVLLAMQATGKPIIECLKDGEWNGTWLYFEEDKVETQGDKTEEKSISPRCVYFNPNYGKVSVNGTFPVDQDPELGVRRLLRV